MECLRPMPTNITRRIYARLSSHPSRHPLCADHARLALCLCLRQFMKSMRTILPFRQAHRLRRLDGLHRRLPLPSPLLKLSPVPVQLAYLAHSVHLAMDLIQRSLRRVPVQLQLTCLESLLCTPLPGEGLPGLIEALVAVVWLHRCHLP
jgi:hypothetical protein